ncbi:MAG: Xylulose-5-phosphate phosphoketolase [Chlamydiia bacterium]|nr:Xylulose-5-phosphate phosphoketolase [Chlamydiia bacterium]
MDEKRLKNIDAYFRACNYLSVGQIYLKDNPLMLKPLEKEHIKKRLLGHFGTSPGLNLIYVHANRLIQDTKLKMIYVAGPGHGGPALRANVYLEGVMGDVYPELSFSKHGIKKFMKEFSWPGGVPSHVSPPTPGSIHEGGELGYSLVHAYGAVMDNPELVALCVVGDGEAETGPLATSWHSNKFINPKRDGTVLPILHLNGYKISGPTVFGRMDDETIQKFFEGCGYKVRFVEGDDPMAVHKLMWEAYDWAFSEIKAIKNSVSSSKKLKHFPMIVLRTPKGWTGPKVVDGKKVEGTFRSHQVPVSDVIDNERHKKILEDWLLSYRPHELFDKDAKPNKDLLSILPEKGLRMGASSYANGGSLLRELNFPDFRSYALEVENPGAEIGEATKACGAYLRDIFGRNLNNFRIFCPDETNSNRLTHVFGATERMYIGEVKDSDEKLSATGRVMEVLSEHMCQGWLEGYLLTGRHGLFPCYEAFALIVDSMLNQHGKWLKACKDLPWRKPIASLNYLLTSHAWRQDHNGYSHQGPGFIETVLEKKRSVARIYLPPDGNCLLSVMDHCLKSKNYINLIVSGKQPMPQWLSMKDAEEHCKKGIGRFEFACNDDSSEPDVIFGSSGDTPTQEVLAAIDILREKFPDIKIRMINVVDLMTLMPREEHPHGLENNAFDSLFTKDKPIIFAFHGHPMVIHQLVNGRVSEDNFHVRGYIEEGTTTTPFDMVVFNDMSRFHLASHAISLIPRFKEESSAYTEECKKKLKEHKDYIYEHGEDLPEIINWKWRVR